MAGSVPTAQKPAPETMQAAHTDTTGPVNPADKVGNCYMQLVLDAASKNKAAHFLTSKSNIPAAILLTLKNWQQATRKTTRRYHADNSPEQPVDALTKPLQDQGTTTTKTTTHSSQQNGIVERTFSQILNVTRAALHAAKIPASYWTFATSDAVDKENVIPCSQPDGAITSPIKDSCPGTLRVHSGMHFLPFGQPGCATNTNPTRTKLSPRALRVRYLKTMNEHQYLVLDSGTGRTRTVCVGDFHPGPLQAAQLEEALLAYQVEQRPTGMMPDPRALTEARRHTDATTWPQAYAAELWRHDTVLRTWVYVPHRQMTSLCHGSLASNPR